MNSRDAVRMISDSSKYSGRRLVPVALISHVLLPLSPAFTVACSLLSVKFSVCPASPDKTHCTPAKGRVDSFAQRSSSCKTRISRSPTR